MYLDIKIYITTEAQKERHLSPVGMLVREAAVVLGGEALGENGGGREEPFCRLVVLLFCLHTIGSFDENRHCSDRHYLRPEISDGLFLPCLSELYDRRPE